VQPYLSVVHAKEIPAMSTYHFAGAYEEAGAGGGKLHVLVNRLIGARSELERNFGDMYGAEWSEPGYNTLCDYVVDIASGDLESSDPLVPPTTGGGGGGGDVNAGQLPMEFPVIAPGAKHRAPRFVYTLGFSGAGGGYFDAVQKLDVRGGGGGEGGRGAHATRVMPPGVFPSEVEFIPRKKSGGGAGDGTGAAAGAAAGAGTAAGAKYEVSEEEEDDGFLLYLEYDAAAHKSSLVILDAKDVTGKPLAVCRLPFHVPHSFHGTFKHKAAAAGAR
jgi:all-trans-8'-apo-beta-carotenal 15,15'-oxygenase